MNLSYWERTSFFKDIDVAVIGGGIVGLNAAISLKETNKQLKVVVLEKGFLPFGASTKNAGFACFGSVSELLSDLEISTESEVFSLVEKRWKGLLKLRNRIGDKNLDFQNLGGYEIFQPKDERLFLDCVNKIDSFNQKIQSITGESTTYKIADEKINEFGFKNVDHMILNIAEGQINSGEMVRHLQNLAQQKGVQLYHGVEVKKVIENHHFVDLLIEDEIRIAAKKVIITTNGFTKKLLPSIKLSPARNQVLVTSIIENLNFNGTFHYDEGYIYFRNIDKRVLIGGGRNIDLNNESTSEFGLTEPIENYLNSILQNNILSRQKFEIDYKWSGIMGVGKTKKPIIKSINDNLFIAVRLGGMGVAIGSLVGEEIADLAYQTI